jgi:hypothetical protein
MTFPKKHSMGQLKETECMLLKLVRQSGNLGQLEFTPGILSTDIDLLQHQSDPSDPVTARTDKGHGYSLFWHSGSIQESTRKLSSNAREREVSNFGLMLLCWLAVCAFGWIYALSVLLVKDAPRLLCRCPRGKHHSCLHLTRLPLLHFSCLVNSPVVNCRVALQNAAI